MGLFIVVFGFDNKLLHQQIFMKMKTMKPKAVQVGELNKLPLHYSLCSPNMWLSTLCNGDITLFNNLTLHCLDTLYHYKPKILTAIFLVNVVIWVLRLQARNNLLMLRHACYLPTFQLIIPILLYCLLSYLWNSVLHSTLSSEFVPILNCNYQGKLYIISPCGFDKPSVSREMKHWHHVVSSVWSHLCSSCFPVVECRLNR